LHLAAATFDAMVSARQRRVVIVGLGPGRPGPHGQAARGQRTQRPRDAGSTYAHENDLIMWDSAARQTPRRANGFSSSTPTLAHHCGSGLQTVSQPRVQRLDNQWRLAAESRHAEPHPEERLRPALIPPSPRSRAGKGDLEELVRLEPATGLEDGCTECGRASA
jgi:hypothetical protein